MKTFFFSLLALGAGLLIARAEQVRTDINPALVYYRSFLVPTEPVTDADRDYLASKKGKEQKLPDSFLKFVTGSDKQFDLIHQATHCTPPCDWGVDPTPGANTLLPHLARARAAGQIAQVRALWALQHGRPGDAREELLSAFVLGRQLQSDTILISTLVEWVMESQSYETIAQNFGELSSDTLKQLVAQFEAAPARRTVADSMPGERSLGEWVIRKIVELQKTYPRDDAKVMQGIHEMVDFAKEPNLWPEILKESGGTSEGVLKLAREMEAYYPRISGLMSLPEPEYEVQSETIRKEIEEMRNPFRIMFTPFFVGFGNVGPKGMAAKVPLRAREFRIQAESAMLHAALEYKLGGQDGLKTVADPFGHGPFAFRRFKFKGIDRGFELKSAYSGNDAPFIMIFVEKRGPAFEVLGPNAGKEIAK